MVILGIDPGWDRCGWAKIHMDKGKAELLESGLISTSRQKLKHQRLADLMDEACRLFKKGPVADWVVLEELHPPPPGYRIANLVQVGEARGVLLAAASHTGAEVREIHPLAVKNLITGNGRASKEEVARFLKMLVTGAPVEGPDDTTDAIAIAVAAGMSKTPNGVINARLS